MPIDPTSPVPLYHQIAQSIRTDIESGRLRSGDALIPLREAAEHWGVNVHTVRHAYAALAREGLLEANRGPKGTRVARGAQGRMPVATPLPTFLDDVLAEARRTYDLGAEELAAALRRRGGDRLPEVYVVECSEWQARCHAEEVTNRFRVRAIPWTLDRGEPPEGTVLATYFHYNDVRRRWPLRLSDVCFVSIRPDPALRDRFADADEVWVCEREADTAEAVAADLVALFAPGHVDVRTRVDEDPNRLVPPQVDTPAPHLFAPRTWAELSQERREHPSVHELRYVFDQDELERVGSREGWPPATTSELKPTKQGVG